MPLVLFPSPRLSALRETGTAAFAAAPAVGFAPLRSHRADADTRPQAREPEVPS
jgi:hypothetical protein